MRDFSVPENGNRCIVYFSWWFSSYARIFHGTSNKDRKMLWSDLEVITFWELLPRLVDASSYKNRFSSPSQAKFWVFGVQSCCLWSKKYCSEHNIRVTTSKTVVFFLFGFFKKWFISRLLKLRNNSAFGNLMAGLNKHWKACQNMVLEERKCCTWKYVICVGGSQVSKLLLPCFVVL